MKIHAAEFINRLPIPEHNSSSHLKAYLKLLTILDNVTYDPEIGNWNIQRIDYPEGLVNVGYVNMPVNVLDNMRIVPVTDTNTEQSI